MTKQKN